MKNLSVQMTCLLIVMICVGQGYAAEPLQPMTIQLNWIPNVQFAGVLLAKERGWYAEAGIDLTIKGWEENLIVVDELVSGKAQVGVVEGDALIKARDKGTPLKAIATQLQRTPFCLMSKKARGIETPKQLVGKKIGINSPESELMTKIVLKNQGLKFEDITPVQVGWDLQPLIKDEIDVFAAFMNDEPISMKLQGHEVTYIPAFKYGYDFYSGVYVVTETLLREKPKLIQQFLQVTLRGWAEAFKDPAATAKLIIAKYYPDGSLPHQTGELELSRTLATLGEGKKFLGWMEENLWAKGVNLLYEFQQIGQKIPAKDLFTMEFLEGIYFGKK